MCGGFKPSRQWIAQKDEQAQRELARLSRLQSGSIYSFPTSEGLQRFRFDGHARMESMETIWNSKIEKEVVVEVSEFYERNTVGNKRHELIPFKSSNDFGIKAIIVNGGLRIVTKPANETVGKYHHRQPVLVKLDNAA